MKSTRSVALITNNEITSHQNFRNSAQALPLDHVGWPELADTPSMWSLSLLRCGHSLSDHTLYGHITAKMLWSDQISTTTPKFVCNGTLQIPHTNIGLR